MHADDALGMLITDAGDRLLRLAFQLTHDRAAAEDVVQEALMSIYRSWRRHGAAVDSLEAYARRAVVNAFLQRARRKSSTEIVTATLPESSQPGFEDAVTERDMLWQALGRLPVRQRAVLVLRYYADLPDADIAAWLGAREGTVRSLASRALSALRAGELAVEGGMT